MTKQPWPEDRRREFERLQQLVSLAGRLNTSSHIASHVLHLETLADTLERCDIGDARQSFMNWLEKEATGQ